MNERQKIIRWLRGQHRRTCLFGPDFADRIERGDHLAFKPEPTVPYEEWRDKPSVGF